MLETVTWNGCWKQMWNPSEQLLGRRALREGGEKGILLIGLRFVSSEEKSLGEGGREREWKGNHNTGN